jgi:ABC-2 type transport system ATP-binding protein
MEANTSQSTEEAMQTLTDRRESDRSGSPRLVIHLEGLTKRFGRRIAVDGLSIDVPEGVVAGFVGPNGAGKSTTLRVLLGLVRPTSGTGTVLGNPLDDPPSYLSRVGGLIEGPAFHPALSGTRNLEVLAALADKDLGQIPQLLRQVGLQSRSDDPYRTYSLGMKQRLGVAGALLGEPELLLLDEPSNGLDPAGIREMRELIGSLSREDRTVLVSSHLLIEVEQVCDWLVMIEEGRLVYQGPTADLIASTVTGLVVAPRDRGDIRALSTLLESNGYPVEADGDHLTVAVRETDPMALAADINRSAMEGGIVLAELSHVRAGLEERYLAMVGGNHD